MVTRQHHQWLCALSPSLVAHQPNKMSKDGMINGEAEYVAVGGDRNQGVEIWDINSKRALQVLQTDSAYNQCLASTNNILAVASSDGNLRMWDVRNWEVFHSAQFSMKPMSLHLTADSKFLTIGGDKGDSNCVVMEIK